MRFFWVSEKEPQYTSVLDEGETHRVQLRRSSHLRHFVVAAFVVAALFLGIGIAFGRYLANRVATSSGLLLPSGTITQTWQHNRIFSSLPNPASEDAWLSIVPIGRGFVRHPVLSPETHDMSVFHQLHCLHGLRAAYYDALSRLNGTSDPFVENVAAHYGSHDHIQHCFDYLRQALMCAADTNFEVVNQGGTSSGWGSERVCRDYKAVSKWAEKWRTTDEYTID